MIRLEMKRIQYDIDRDAAKVSALSSGKIDKYQFITGEEILPSNQIQIMQQAKFAYSPLRKAFEKHTENWVGAVKFLDLPNKKDELKQIESIFPQNLMNDLVCVKFKEIVTFQDIIKTDNLSYKSKSRKVYSLREYSLTMFLLFRNVHKGHLSLNDADYEQSNFAAKIKNLDKGKKQHLKKKILNILGLLFSATEKVINNYKSNMFLIKSYIKFQHVNQHVNQQQN